MNGMHEARRYPPLTDRYDLEFPRRGDPRRRRMWRVTAIAAAATLAVLVGLALWGEQRLYWSGPLASPHASLQQDCRRCHSRVGQPLVRLFTANDQARSVHEQDCHACHPRFASHDHHPLMQHEPVRDCLVCHTEHRGHEALKLTGDQSCIACHQQLQTKPPGRNTFVAAISSFERGEHPEFALRDGRQPGPAHGVHGRAEFRDSAWRDRSVLHFNHAAHLKPAGLPMPPSSESPTGSPARVHLSCNDCHQPERGGAYMAAVTYERHCRECHPLRFTAASRTEPLPHQPWKTVVAEVRDRLLNRPRAEPDADGDSDVGRLPKPAVEPTPDELDRLRRELRTVRKGCQICHAFEPGEKSPEEARVRSPNLPDRWLTHGRFDHGRHTQYACVVCHDPYYLETRGDKLLPAGVTSTPEERILPSRDTADILLPSIAVCRKCHASSGDWGVHAPFGCARCHVYHGAARTE